MPSKRISVIVAVFTCFLLIADGSLILYACLLWPRAKVLSGDPLFVVGVLTFVACFTLPFCLIVGFMVCSVCSEGNKEIICRCSSSGGDEEGGQRKKHSSSIKNSNSFVFKNPKANNGTSSSSVGNNSKKGGDSGSNKRGNGSSNKTGNSTNKKTGSSGSKAGSDATAGIKNLHRLDLLPPSFVSAHFGAIMRHENPAGNKTDKNNRVSVLSCDSARPLPKVSFARTADGREVMSVVDNEDSERNAETFSKVTTEV